MNASPDTPHLSGRLLRSSLTEFTMGCPLSQTDDTPPFGALVRISQGNGDTIFGIVYNITVEPDGLVRQLVTSDEVDDQVIDDARTNRINPLEVGVLAVGYRANGTIRHLLPPHPPISLDAIYPCTPAEVAAFTSVGSGYLRHIIFFPEANIGELLAAHLERVNLALEGQDGQGEWMAAALDKIIDLLRADFNLLSRVLYSLADTGLFDFDPDETLDSLAESLTL